MLLGPVYLENLVGIAVDEAHCVKKWYIFVPFDALLLIIIIFFYTRGKEFRKEFCSIGEVRSLIHENVQFMTLTATATSSSRAEICSILGMKQPKIVSSSPNRPNIK